MKSMGHYRIFITSITGLHRNSSCMESKEDDIEKLITEVHVISIIAVEGQIVYQDVK